MDRRTRVRALLALLAVFALLFAFQAVTADRSEGGVTQSDDTVTNNTLITVQNYGGFGGTNGGAVIVSPEGETVWEFKPDARVFDAEVLDNGNVLVSMATEHDDLDCPDEHTEIYRSTCVENRVVEVDRATNDIVWEYNWYDELINHHEVHDADRLDNGETAIADMGNHRAFTVDQSGEITWQWNASEHLTPGTPFYEEYGGPIREGEETDWTHMNDIDRLDNGNFQLSIRNFDVVIEVDPETNETVSVLGRPRAQVGDDALLHKQHNPHRIEGSGTVLIADSENDRIVEVTEDGEQIWAYGGSGILQWPRDADRHPNGHTLITDSLNNRVLEVDTDGEVVWEYEVTDDGQKGIPYEADRLGLPEEPDDGPRGTNLTGRTDDAGTLVSTLRHYESWALFALPAWVGRAELLTLLGAGLVVLWLVGEGVVFGVRRGWAWYQARDSA
jgi:hypothetical protein